MRPYGATNRERQRDRAARIAIESRRIQLDLATKEADQVGRQIAARRPRQIADRAKNLAQVGAGRVASAKDLGLEADESEASVIAFDDSIQQTRLQPQCSKEQLEAVLASGVLAPSEPAGPTLAKGQPWTSENAQLEESAADADLASLASLERRLDVARAELKGIESQSASFEVVSPIDGRITAVSVAAGSAVLKAEALATEEPPGAQELQVFLPERSAPGVIPEEFLVVRALQPQRTSRVTVVRAFHRMTRLPDALQLDPTRVARGRAVYLRPPGDLSILPGERIIATRAPKGE